MREVRTKFVPDNTVNQLILLYILDKMEIPLTESSLIDICTNGRNWLSYMDFKVVLGKLLEFDFVSQIIDRESENRYKITESGTNCIALFYQKIPSTLREDINNFAKENRMKFKRNQEYVSTYTKNADNSYTATFKIISPTETLPVFELKMQFATRQSAISASKKWKDKAPSVYEFVYDLLGD